MRGVELLFGLETLAQSLGQDPVHHLTDLFVVDTRQAFDRAKRAVDADGGRQLVREVKVGGAVSHRVGEQLVYVQGAVRVQRRRERLYVRHPARSCRKGPVADVDSVFGLPVTYLVVRLDGTVGRHVVRELGAAHGRFGDLSRRGDHRCGPLRRAHLCVRRYRRGGQGPVVGRKSRVDGVHEVLDGDGVGQQASGNFDTEEGRDLALLG